MNDKPTPPSPEVQEEQRVRTIKERFKGEIAEMLATELFDKMGNYLEENEGHLNWLDLTDASLAIIESLCLQQCAIAKEAGVLMEQEVRSRWGMQLLRMVEKVRAGGKVKGKSDE